MAFHLPNTVLDGVLEDLSTLVYDFMSTGKTDFSTFVDVWKQNYFCYIFSGRVMVKEVKYFTREILIMAKKRCSSKNSNPERILGIYLMYALYYVQPLKVPVRIRVEKDEFFEMTEFVKECPQKEARYCFFQLFVDHAFDYVYSEKLFSLERIRERDLDMKSRKCETKNLTAKEQVESIWKTIGFDQMSWLDAESDYNKIKSSLNVLSDGSNFEMTEFLKPLLTIKENITSTSSTSKSAVEPSGSKVPRRERKRRRSAFNVLEEAPSSSEEEAVGGDGSMPHLDYNRSDAEEEDEDDDGYSN